MMLHYIKIMLCMLIMGSGIYMYSSAVTSTVKHDMLEQQVSEKTVLYTQSLMKKYPTLKAVWFVQGIEMCRMHEFNVLLLPASWNMRIEEADPNIYKMIDLFLQKHFVKKSVRRNLINHWEVVTTSLITLSMMALVYQVYKMKEAVNGIDNRIKNNYLYKFSKDLEKYLPQQKKNLEARIQKIKDHVEQHVVSFDPLTFPI